MKHHLPSSLLSGALHALPWLPFLYLFCCSDVLYQAQSRSLFMQGTQFWEECMRSAGGAVTWVALALTQLFYYPWLGSLALLILWVGLWWLLRRVFPTSTRWQWLHMLIPFCLFASCLDLGYWTYYLKYPGYYFRPTLGILATVLLLLWRHRRWGWLMSLITLCFYPLLGCWAVLALMLRALRSGMARQWINCLTASLLALIGPGLLSSLYANLRPVDAWTVGFPFIVSNQYHSLPRTLPFLLILALFVLLIVLAHRAYRFGVRVEPEVRPLSLRTRLRPFVLTLLFAGISWWVNFGDHNYHAELRITRAIERFDWRTVLDEVSSAPHGVTRQMVVDKNLALLYTGHLSDLFFAFPNAGIAPAATDSLAVHLNQTCAPQSFLYHGMVNDAIHWSIENSVEYGLTVADLRTMSLAAIIAGESQLATKYLQMLSLTWFHRSFVRRYYPLTQHPEWITDYPELQLMQELHQDLEEYVDGDDGNTEWRIYRCFSQQLVHRSPVGRELALTYAMMRKDQPTFWHHLACYADLLSAGKVTGESLAKATGEADVKATGQSVMPLQYQQAAYLFTQLDPTGHPASDYRFDPVIPQAYASFEAQAQQYLARHHSDAELTSDLQPLFGSTYWWFFYFCNN